MPTVVDLKDASSFFGGMSDDLLRAARVGLVKAGERGVQKIVTEIIPSRSPQPVDRGTYKAGWKTERINANTVAILNPEPHAPIIEDGVRAENVKIGTALIRALAGWAMRKGIAEDETSAVGVAWAIAKAMQKRGIFTQHSGKGLGILRELEDSFLEDILQTEISREMQRAADRAR